MKKAATIVSVLVISIVFITIACSRSASTVNLTIPLPLTGSESRFGQIQKHSYEIAAADINAGGGIRGKRLILRFEDTRGKPEVSKAVAEKIIDVDKQPVLVGEYSSGCAMAVASVAEEHKVPYLVVSSAADDITEGDNKYIFRQNVPNAHYTDGLISFLNQVVKPKTIAIIHESSAFGTSGAEDMAKAAARNSIKVLAIEKYKKGATNFRHILHRVKAEEPDVIYMVSYAADAALLMKQIKELRVQARLFAGNAAGFAIPEFIDWARDAAEDVVTVTLWSPKLNFPGARRYADKYKSIYGDYPSYHGASAYSALFVIKDALERAPSWTPDDIRNAMKATDIMTAFGPVSFIDREGYRNQNFMDTFVLQVIGGEYETIWPLQYATGKYVYPIKGWRGQPNSFH
jgi:branched-chain amino acid transport system substrate-binding protein